MKYRLTNYFEKLQRHIFVQAIHRALVNLIPVLIVGSFSILLESLPVEGFVAFISTWCGGIIYNLLNMLYMATFNMLSVYMAGLIGYQFGILSTEVKTDNRCATMLVSLGCFFILSGATDGSIEAFGTKGMFVAIVSAGMASQLYVLIAKRIRRKRLLTDGADVNLGNAIHTIFPVMVTLAVFALCNEIILRIFQAESFYQLIMTGMTCFSNRVGAGVGGGLIYTLLTNILWFFGIHGSDVLEGVADPMFRDAINRNLILAQNGQMPTEIITRQFINNFVMIGGCGSTICLLIALFIFSKRKEARGLTKLSFVPMLFNINEIMVFGLPIIYNPIFLIPFLLVPVVSFLIAYFSMHVGLVPLVTKDVSWTLPILFNGYLSTGSVAGILLQVVNISAGVLIYSPFVKLYDKRMLEASKLEYASLVEKLKKSEEARKPIQVTDDNMSFGWMGKALAADLRYAFEHGELKLFYQPQYNDRDECVGVEALLRWKHSTLGQIYPPLVFKIAEETGMLEKLEEWVITEAIKTAESLKEKYPDNRIKVSINVTGVTIEQAVFEDFLADIAEKKDIRGLKICIEITEQDAFLLDDTMRERFYHLREMGYVLAVDDFSMGSTSIRYLTGNHFELVKLDGSLVKGIMDNPRCREIIASIVHLSDTLGVQVLAEYVSDAGIREKLLEVGCRLYQGWYYSPAVELEEFEKILEKEEH